MSNDILEFNRRPPRAYKLVKRVKIELRTIDGSLNYNQEVAVYMRTAGTPTFNVFVPQQYREAWDKHRDECLKRELYSFTEEGFMYADSFDRVLAQLKTMSHCYGEFIHNMTMERVLWVYSELRSPGISHNRVSFTSSDTYVGIRIGHGWRVNGKLYEEMRNRASDEDIAALPKPAFKDLLPVGHPRDVVLPFDMSMWQTLVGVETTLQRAAQVLHGLAQEATAVPLLTSGLKLLK